MNIALMAHDNRKELMIQFCIAYCGILSKHTICATGTTGRVVAEATGMDVKQFMARAHGGVQQIGARITYDVYPPTLRRAQRAHRHQPGHR